MRTYIYVDGFNLYYGAVKDTPYKWLDLKALFTNILAPHHEILKIKYFTARISARADDPQAPTRQMIYLRALTTVTPELSIHYGHFLSHAVMLPLARPTGKEKYARVIRTEEKGSDVNLALHLLNDAWHDRYDCAVIVTNDSDLAECLRFVRQERKKKIGVLTPGDQSVRSTSVQLSRYAHFTKSITTDVLAKSQLPDPIPGTNIHKPKAWSSGKANNGGNTQ